jgi:HAD superfamily phosphoserine phosphatase-like hydrolase
MRKVAEKESNLLALDMKSKTAAVFDFDQTLTQHDTLFLWLTELNGLSKTLKVILQASAHEILRYIDCDAVTIRTRIKSILFSQLLKGVAIETAIAAAVSIGKRVKWRADTTKALIKHQDSGHRVVIATGSATIYVRTLLSQRFSNVEVIGTELECANGYLTGEMGTNCIYYAKAAMVNTWLQQNGPFAECWGYGNFPHDLPMLMLMTRSMII